jgi:hypothetical protein
MLLGVGDTALDVQAIGAAITAQIDLPDVKKFAFGRHR